MIGTIFNIQKFCVNDGPGIRTTVFIKGCPLNCIWCHNPESKSRREEIMFDPSKCIFCGKCTRECQNHKLSECMHTYVREGCTVCGRCAELCLTGAIEKVGYSKESGEIINEVLKDEPFYKNSGGGMTLSGGEPMAQFEFTLDLLKKAKENNLHVCMETCGYAPLERYLEAAQYVDIFLFDYKISDPSDHKKYTGVSNELILSNLMALDKIGARIVLRCPIIPGINDNEGHFKKIGELANSLLNVIEVNVEPYHPLGESKSEKLGKEYLLSGVEFPSADESEKWINEISSYTNVPVKRA